MAPDSPPKVSVTCATIERKLAELRADPDGDNFRKLCSGVKLA
jgi:hypothetical protein